MYTPTVVPMLDTLKGLTVFAPSNDAFAAAAGLLGTVNASVIATVLANHIINGTVVSTRPIANPCIETDENRRPRSTRLPSPTPPLPPLPLDSP